MIHPRNLAEIIFAEPFQAFRMHTASGRTFDVRHPELVKLGRSTVTVYQPERESPDRWQEISLMLLESVEPLETSSRSDSGGANN